MLPTLADRKRRNRIMLGVSLTAIVLWIIIGTYIHFFGKKGKSVLVLIPFMFIAALNAFNAYRRLRQLKKEESETGA